MSEYSCRGDYADHRAHEDTEPTPIFDDLAIERLRAALEDWGRTDG